jgi:YHS domain-containing protein
MFFILVCILFIACSKLLSGGVDPVNKNNKNLALRGYDAVAYFTGGKLAAGRAEFQHKWQDAIWYFSSAANRDAFAKNPEKYAPQYGGYCAWAVAHNYTADGDPQAWKIVDGKLYLNYNLQVREMWEKAIPTYIKKGDENWPRLVKKEAKSKN